MTKLSAMGVLRMGKHEDTSYKPLGGSTPKTEVSTPTSSFSIDDYSVKECVNTSSTFSLKNKRSFLRRTFTPRRLLKRKSKDLSLTCQGNAALDILGIQASPFPAFSPGIPSCIYDDDATKDTNSTHLIGTQRSGCDESCDYTQTDGSFHVESLSPMLGSLKSREETEIIFEGSYLPNELIYPKRCASLFDCAWRENNAEGLAIEDGSNKNEMPVLACDPTGELVSTMDTPVRLQTAKSGLSQSKSPALSPKRLANICFHRNEQPESPRSRNTYRRVRIKESSKVFSKKKYMPSKNCPTTQDEYVKIILLLLQPNSKIFELIQLEYPSASTTIGDILRMIPKNASEPALAVQRYVGITRPKSRAHEFNDLSILASNSTCRLSANFCSGDLLLAIPFGFTSKHVISLSKQILANPRIQKLLQRTDAARKAAAVKCSTPKSSNRSCKYSDTPEDMQYLLEEEIEEEALKRAVEKAEAANAEVACPAFLPSSDDASDCTPRSRSGSLGNYIRATSFVSSLNSASSTDGPPSSCQCDDESTGSLESSYLTWSQSLDRSWTSRYTSLSPAKPIVAPKEQTPRHRTIFKSSNGHRVALLGCALLLAYYYADPNGYASAEEHREMAMHVAKEPLGIFGFFNFVAAWIGLVKLQRYLQSVVLNDTQRPVRQSSSMLHS